MYGSKLITLLKSEKIKFYRTTKFYLTWSLMLDEKEKPDVQTEGAKNCNESNNNAIWTDGFYGFCLRADVASELTDSRHPPQIWISSAHGCALCKKLYIQTREYPGALELCNPTASPPPAIDVSSLSRLLQWSTRFTNLRRGRSKLLQNLCKFSFSLSAKMSIGHPHLLLLVKVSFCKTS